MARPRGAGMAQGQTLTIRGLFVPARRTLRLQCGPAPSEECAVERIKGALVVAFLRLFALLPWRAAQAVGSLIGWLMWKLPNRSREVVRINLAQCFPELDEAARERLAAQSLRDIGRTLTESACAWIWPAAKSLQQIRQVEG